MTEHQVRPLLVSTKNAVAAIGQDWRWVRSFALNNGVKIYGKGTKAFVDADELLDALKRKEDDQDSEASVLKILGKRRRA